MTMTSRSSPVISARVSSETKARFAALAARHQLSESSLLAKMAHEVIRAHGPIAPASHIPCTTGVSAARRDASDRITLRLRPGDRLSVARRALARDMKTGTYLALLIHNHVHAAAVLPPDELLQIKAVAAQLAALGRQLRVFGMTNPPEGSTGSELHETLALLRREVESAREATAAVVRRNLLSWEAGGGSAHA